MEWYVYRHDSNRGTIYKYNVLQPYIIEEIKNRIEEPTTFSNFKEIVEKEMRYYYWSKSEHEVIIKEWCGNPAELKVDIFNQLQLNWEAFVLHFWNCLLEEGINSKEAKEKSYCEDCYCCDCAYKDDSLQCIGCRHCENGDDFIEKGGCGDYLKEGYEDIEEEVEENEPTCDSAWWAIEGDNWVCANCKGKALYWDKDVFLSDFCPHCGASMENCSCGKIKMVVVDV